MKLELWDRELRAAWWSYLGRAYPGARAAGIVWVSAGSARLAARLAPGDLIVHEYLRRIVSVSRVTGMPRSAEASQPTASAGDSHPTLRVSAVYLDVPAPIHICEL